MSPLPRVTWTPALRIAAGVAALALLADVALLARAARTSAESPVVPLRLAPVKPFAPRARASEALVDSARAIQPFEPLDAPQTLADAGTVIPQAAAVSAQPRLVGTVLDGARSFIVLALADGAMKVVRLGERAGDLTLRSVTAGGATFDDTDGGRVTLRSPTPGAEPQP